MKKKNDGLWPNEWKIPTKPRLVNIDEVIESYK